MLYFCSNTTQHFSELLCLFLQISKVARVLQALGKRMGKGTVVVIVLMWVEGILPFSLAILRYTYISKIWKISVIPQHSPCKPFYVGLCWLTLSGYTGAEHLSVRSLYATQRPCSPILWGQNYTSLDLFRFYGAGTGIGKKTIKMGKQRKIKVCGRVRKYGLMRKRSGKRENKIKF